MTLIALQDQIPDNHCFGCGPLNPQGLQIKSYLQGEESWCDYQPQPWQMAGPEHLVNGGILATLLDCHAVCTAMGLAYADAGRAVGSAPLLWCATTELSVRYRRPTPIDQPLRLVARLLERLPRQRYRLACEVLCQGEVTVRAEVTAAVVPEGWKHGG